MKTCKACFLQMRDLQKLDGILLKKWLFLLQMPWCVSSRLDYCNSLCRGLSCFNRHKLENIQNARAHIVTNLRQYVHITPILKQLHWLPVNFYCMFKTTTLLYKFLHSGSPSYFGPFLSLSCSYSAKRSHPNRQYLTVPSFISSLCKSVQHVGHSFAFDAPKIWNNLPNGVCSATSFASFRKKVKSYLFAKVYLP